MACFDVLAGWDAEMTIKLCKHVQQHGVDDWEALAAVLGCPAKLCELRWHAALCTHLRSVCRSPKFYSEWELCTLYVGVEVSRAAASFKRGAYNMLSGWMPGRTANGLKQAYQAHVQSNETQMAAKLLANQWPTDLAELLMLWPGPRQELQCTPDDAKASAKAILDGLAASWRCDQAATPAASSAPAPARRAPSLSRAERPAKARRVSAAQPSRGATQPGGAPVSSQPALLPPPAARLPACGAGTAAAAAEAAVAAAVHEARLGACLEEAICALMQQEPALCGASAGSSQPLHAALQQLLPSCADGSQPSLLLALAPGSGQCPAPLQPSTGSTASGILAQPWPASSSRPGELPSPGLASGDDCDSTVEPALLDKPDASALESFFPEDLSDPQLDPVALQLAGFGQCEFNALPARAVELQPPSTAAPARAAQSQQAPPQSMVPVELLQQLQQKLWQLEEQQRCLQAQVVSLQAQVHAAKTAPAAKGVAAATAAVRC